MKFINMNIFYFFDVDNLNTVVHDHSMEKQIDTMSIDEMGVERARLIQEKTEIDSRIQVIELDIQGLYQSRKKIIESVQEIDDKIRIATFARKGIRMAHDKFFSRQGDMLNSLGLLRAATVLDRRITREEYEAFIKVNYSLDIDASLPDHFLKTIHKIWKSFNTEFKNSNFLESWSPSEIVVRDLSLKS
jgi:hypothetical protein